MRLIRICLTLFSSVIMIESFYIVVHSWHTIHRSIPFSFALNLSTLMQSLMILKRKTGWWLRIREFASSWEKSRKSLIRKTIRFEQFLAILKKRPPLPFSIKGSRRSRELTMALRGFLNSCAAEAKARDCNFLFRFWFSNSTHYDMSLIVVMANFSEPD